MNIIFKEKQVDLILNGTKIHAIIKDKKDKWVEGMTMSMLFNMKTRKHKHFKYCVCKSIQNIEIIRTSDYLEQTIVKVDGRILTEDETRQLAWNDGFINLMSFWLHFKDGFSGKILHWTDLKYTE